jgi:hypothetical protein
MLVCGIGLLHTVSALQLEADYPTQTSSATVTDPRETANENIAGNEVSTMANLYKLAAKVCLF